MASNGSWLMAKAPPWCWSRCCVPSISPWTRAAAQFIYCMTVWLYDCMYLLGLVDLFQNEHLHMQGKFTGREREREHVLHEHRVVFERIAVSILYLMTRCFSCVLSCISLPLAAGSLLFSGSPLLKRPHLFMGSLFLSHTLSNPLWFKLPFVWRCWPLGLTEVRENDLWGQPHCGAEH